MLSLGPRAKLHTISHCQKFCRPIKYIQKSGDGEREDTRPRVRVIGGVGG